MTKADIVNRIAQETGMEKMDVQSTVEGVHAALCVIAWKVEKMFICEGLEVLL